jgi:hypothetical protein
MKHVNHFLLTVFLLTVSATFCLAEEKKDTIGIMKFNVSENLNSALEIFLYDSLMDKMVASGKYTVVHWKKIESTLDDIKRFRPRISHEATQKQAIKKLGLLNIYTGSLSKVGTNYFLAVNVLNPALLVERTVRDSVKSEDELDSLVDLIARLLLVTPEEAERLRAEEEARAAKKKKAKERKMLEEERLQLEEERGIEIDRDGRFIAYSKGIVVDSETGFMWAAEDNGYEIGWDDARTYCKSYRGAGYKDWRMPTLNELAGLYGTGEGYVPMDGSVDEVEISGLIRLTSWWVWSSETRDSDAAAFNFCPGNRDWYRQTFSGSVRALPVRTDK